MCLMATGAGIVLGPGLKLPVESVTSTFAILANRGAGKSATAHRFVEQLHRAGLPVVVVDVKGDWWGIRSSADGAGAGLPFVIFGGEHADVPLEPGAGEVIADVIATDQISAVLDLSHLSKTKARTFATAFAERLYLRNRDPLHVVVEEADVLVPQRATAATARLLGAWEDIAKRGRHRGLGLTVVSQRPQEVSKSVLDLMETVILLRMTGPRSIKAAQDWISVNADADGTTAAQVIASLPALETGHGWVWSPALLRTLQQVDFALFDTFDSHATPTPGQRRVMPKTRADIDLDALGAEIAATVERAKDNDPAALRAEIARLHRDLAAGHPRSDDAHPRAVAADLAAKDRQLEAQNRQLSAQSAEIARLRDRIADLEARPTVPAGLVDALDAAQRHLHTARHLADTDDTTPAPVAAPTAPTTAPIRPTLPVPRPVSTPGGAGRRGAGVVSGWCRADAHRIGADGAASVDPDPVGDGGEDEGHRRHVLDIPRRAASRRPRRGELGRVHPHRGRVRPHRRPARPAHRPRTPGPLPVDPARRRRPHAASGHRRLPQHPDPRAPRRDRRDHRQCGHVLHLPRRATPQRTDHRRTRTHSCHRHPHPRRRHRVRESTQQ